MLNIVYPKKIYAAKTVAANRGDPCGRMLMVEPSTGSSPERGSVSAVVYTGKSQMLLKAPTQESRKPVLRILRKHKASNEIVSSKST
jgi:hypothetical protein